MGNGLRLILDVQYDDGDTPAEARKVQLRAAVAAAMKRGLLEGAHPARVVAWSLDILGFDDRRSPVWIAVYESEVEPGMHLKLLRQAQEPTDNQVLESLRDQVPIDECVADVLSVVGVAEFSKELGFRENLATLREALALEVLGVEVIEKTRKSPAFRAGVCSTCGTKRECARD